MRRAQDSIFIIYTPLYYLFERFSALAIYATVNRDGFPPHLGLVAATTRH